MVSLIVAIVVILLAVWAVQTLTASMGTPEPLRGILIVAIVVIGALYILSLFTGGAGLRVFR